MNATSPTRSTRAAGALETVPLWIAGKPVDAEGGRQGDVTCAATGQVVRVVPFANRLDVDRAVQAAASALPAWRDTAPLRRARIMTRFRELIEAQKNEIAALISEEHGKVFLDALGSVQRGIEVVEFACGAPHLLKGEFAASVGGGVDAYSRLHPVGVCAGITPFNFPAMVPMWMFPIALVCGNTFVLKPSEKDPSPSVRIAQLLKDAGLPDGVFNVVHGDRETVEAILEHPGIDAVSFVGSTPVARHVYRAAAAAGKRVQSLGGAKNHAVVMPDADLDAAVDAIVGAAFGSAGERCMAISAVVAVGSAADPLVSSLAQKVRALRIGPSMGDFDMGPLVTRAHRDRVRAYVDDGISQGATLVVDGRPLVVAGHENGFFLGPALFDHVMPEMNIYRDELFGPVLVVVRVATLADAIDLINRNRYGNGTALFTSSGAAAQEFENRVEVGMVGINVPIPVPMPFFSFGGWKQSLFGDLHVYGPEGVKFYTRTKAITVRWPRTKPTDGSFHMPTSD
jgi:malonate-semialdehyde dehydrogenase (acetylating)/methylmalonate-semialdehyde dehydrogenase